MDAEVAVAAAPPPDAGWKLDAFILGVQVEEVYILFDEQIQTRLGGLSHDHYAGMERKLTWIENALATLGTPPALSAALTPIRARVERRLDAQVPSLDEFDQALQESMRTAGEIGQLMGKIRGHLDDVDGLQYDIGVFTARLSLCCRTFRGLATRTGVLHGEMLEIYAKEMRRAAVQFVRLVISGEQNGNLRRAFASGFSRELVDISAELDQDFAYTPEKAAGIEKRIETLLSRAGFRLARDVQK